MTSRRIECAARRCGLGLKEVAELLEADVVALDLGPRVGIGIRGVQRANEVGRQIVFALVSGERIERAGEDDTAHVEQHGSNGHLREKVVGERVPKLGGEPE